MIGAFLFMVLFLAVARSLRGWPPAARAGAAAASSLAMPIVVLSLLARFGIHANPLSIVAVFAALIALVLVLPPRETTTSDDTAWVSTTAVALLIGTLTALFGRPPSLDLLVDPWTHLAWSRDLPDALRFYSTGFPAFYAVMGIGDPLVGAFRFAPMLLHAAVAAQFMALSERFGRSWPGAAAAFVFLVVPVAFGKFEPPRPILLAAVFATASWWIALFDRPGHRWKLSSLAVLTCALVITHTSILEVAHLAALALAIQIGDDSVTRTRRFGTVVTIAAAAAVGLAVSPFTVLLFFKPDARMAAVDISRAIEVPPLIDFARMWGLGLGFAAAATAVWFVTHCRSVLRSSWGVLPGLAVWFLLCLTPVGLAAVGVQIPNTLATYRYLLAASLPLAMAAAVTGALAVVRGKLSTAAVIVCAFAAGLDIVLRPTFQPLYGLIAVALTTAVWRITRRPAKRALAAALAAGCLALAIAFRLVIWWPTAPPAASWLVQNGDPDFYVVTNWPITNSLDALAPQPVLDGLAGRDANIGSHRAGATLSIHDRIDWCAARYSASADSLRAALEQRRALPAYLVVGNQFEEAWRVYANQRPKEPVTSPFFAHEPCSEDPAVRLLRIRSALGDQTGVIREFETPTVTIYSIR